MSLTPAERLQAYSSPITDWIRELQQKFIDVEDGLQQSLRWNVARGCLYIIVSISRLIILPIQEEISWGWRSYAFVVSQPLGETIDKETFIYAITRLDPATICIPVK